MKVLRILFNKTNMANYGLDGMRNITIGIKLFYIKSVLFFPVVLWLLSLWQLLVTILLSMNVNRNKVNPFIHCILQHAETKLLICHGFYMLVDVVKKGLKPLLTILQGETFVRKKNCKILGICFREWDH